MDAAPPTQWPAIQLPGIFPSLDHTEEGVYIGHAGAEDRQLHPVIFQKGNARSVDKCLMLRDLSGDIGVKHDLAVDRFI